MTKTIVSALMAVVLLTLLLGVAYPLAITGISQVAFGEKADGDPSLVASKPRGKRYFIPRPSATGWSTEATFFANRGPNQASARDFYADELAKYLERERPYSPGLVAADVPVDAVTTSGSGVDPHISRDNARIQGRRLAKLRGLTSKRVDELIDAHTDGRFLGLLGEPGVNVTELNQALDSEAR